MQRKIVHVDMDAFYASVEQRDDPSLRGKPVIVAWRGDRSVVCAASYEARPYGVHSAMAARRAERLCPQAIFVPPDFTRYKAVSRQIHTIFRRHTDLIEPVALDEAYLDVTDTALHSATAVARAIRAEIRTETSLTASAGVAPNKFLAKIASDWDKPDGLTVIPPDAVRDFLTPLDVARIPGVGKVMQARLRALGIDTVGELRSRSRTDLENRFGHAAGTRLHDLARGIDPRPVNANRINVQVSSEDTLETDLVLDELMPCIRMLAEKTWASHRRHGHRVARTVTLKLKTTNFHIITRSATPATPPHDAAEVAAIADALRRHVHRPANTRYRLVGIGLSGFVDEADYVDQPDLFGTRTTD